MGFSRPHVQAGKTVASKGLWKRELIECGSALYILAVGLGAKPGGLLISGADRKLTV